MPLQTGRGPVDEERADGHTEPELPGTQADILEALVTGHPLYVQLSIRDIRRGIDGS